MKTGPLIFALKHLHIEWDTHPEPNARLMQVNEEIPAASDEQVDGFLVNTPPGGQGPDDIEQRMLDSIFAGMPQEYKLAFDGLSKFGARRLQDSMRCAHDALRLDKRCRLARQLLSLILAKGEVRCAFGALESEAPNVTAIILGRSAGA